MQKIQAKTWLQWLQIRMLYQEAFPITERKPFSMIYKMQQKGKTDVWYFKEHGKFIGFATTVNGDNVILLDYLAVSKKRRHHGFGSQILKELQNYYQPKGLLIEIERVYEHADNSQERINRKRFYLSNDMKELQVYANLFGVDMELLGYHCQLDFHDYVAFYRDNLGDFAVKHIQKL